MNLTGKRFGKTNSRLSKKLKKNPCTDRQFLGLEGANKATSSKVSKAIGFAKHDKSFLLEETLKTLYTGIIELHFCYCCLVWGCSGVTEINRLQKLQNRGA